MKRRAAGRVASYAGYRGIRRLTASAPARFLKELAKLPPPPSTEKGKEAAEPGEGKMDEDAAATTTSSGSEAREDKKGR
jgi:hypothetical protein